MPTLTSSIKRWLPWGAWFGVWALGCLTIELFGRGVDLHEDLIRGMSLKVPPWSRLALDIAPTLEQHPMLLGLAALFWSLLLWELRPSSDRCKPPYAAWLTLHVLMQCILIWLAVCVALIFRSPIGNIG